MDLRTEISADHRLIKGRMEKLISPFSAAKARKDALRELERMLGSHAEAEERTVYSVAKNLGALGSEIESLESEHRTIDDLLEGVKLAPGSAIRRMRAVALSRLLRRHLKDEEEKILPSLTEQLTPQENHRLAKKYRHLMDVSMVREKCGTVLPFPCGV